MAEAHTRRSPYSCPNCASSAWLVSALSASACPRRPPARVSDTVMRPQSTARRCTWPPLLPSGRPDQRTQSKLGPRGATCLWRPLRHRGWRVDDHLFWRSAALRRARCWLGGEL